MSEMIAIHRGFDPKGCDSWCIDGTQHLINLERKWPTPVIDLANRQWK